MNGSDASISKIVMAALVIFGAGVLTGGVTVGVANRAARGGRTVLAKIPETPTPWTNGGAPARMMPNLRPPGAARLDQSERMARDLDLSPEQANELKRLLTASRTRLVQIWKPVFPEAQAEVEDFQRKLRAILSPDQREKLDRLQPTRRNLGPAN